MGALDDGRAGLAKNHHQHPNRLRAAGSGIGEKLWRMPLGPKYDKLMDSEIADMRNVSNSRDAGSITAAQFPQRLRQPGRPLAPLHIARMALAGQGHRATAQRAPARGV